MATEDSAAEPKGKSKKGLSRSTILIVVLLLVVAGGGVYFFLGSDSGTAESGAQAQPEPEPIVMGEVVTLEPIFINLKDGRFLKLGMALQTTHEGGGGGHGGGDTEMNGAMALDAAIEVFSDQDMEMIATTSGRQQLKDELVARVIDGYGPEVTNIYFTEFVMQ